MKNQTNQVDSNKKTQQQNKTIGVLLALNLIAMVTLTVFVSINYVKVNVLYADEYDFIQSSHIENLMECINNQDSECRHGKYVNFHDYLDR